MRKIAILFVSALVILFVADSCKHKPTEELIPGDTSTYLPVTKPNDTICFSSDILPLVIATCSKPGCHALNSYASVMQVVRAGKATSSDLYRYAKYGSSEMVVYPQTLIPLDTASLSKIAKWINQGAVNSICNNCDTVNVKYSTHIQPLLTQNCTGCHTSSGTLLATYAQVKAKVDDGKLYCSISWNTGCLKMPQGGAKLSDCKIRAVKMWIDAGAPNN